MSAVFLLVALVGFAYFAFTPRIFDWFTIAYASACVYMLPAFLGFARNAGDDTELEFETYLISLCVLVAIIAAAIISDYMSARARSAVRTAGEAENNGRDYALVLAPLTFIGIALTVVNSGDALMSTSKQQMMDTFTIWSLLWRMASITGFAISFSCRQWGLLSGQGLSLLVLWYLGFRSPAVLAVLSVCVLWVSERGSRPIIGSWKLGAFAITFTAVVFCYKKVYSFIKAGQWKDAANVVSSNNFLSDAILDSEAMSRLHIVNTVVEQGYQLPFVPHWKATFVQTVISGDGQAQDPSFGGWIATDLYPDLNFGIASSIWAEMYSTGGWAMLIFFIGFFVLVLHLGSVATSSGSATVRALTCAWMPCWAFYIHRNDSYRMLSFLKQYIVLLLACAIGVFLLRFARELSNPAQHRAFAPRDVGSVRKL